MKKFIAIFSVLVAIATISVFALRATAATPETSNELATVSVVVSQGNQTMFTMTGMECATVYAALPTRIKSQIISEWNKFENIGKTSGSYAGVSYSFNNGFMARYQNYTIRVTNVTPELIRKVINSE